MSVITNPSDATGITGTTNISFEVNNDATAAVDADPILCLLGGDGVAPPNDDLVRTCFTQDSSAEVAYFTQDRNRNGGGFTRIAPVIAIGLPGSTANFSATLRFNGGSGAANLTENIAIINSGGVPALSFSGQISAPGAGAGSERFGLGALAAGINGLALGNGATSGGANGVALGNAADASASGGTALGASSNATGSNATAVGSLATASATSAIAIGRQATSNAAAIFIGENATVIGAGYFQVGSTALPITTYQIGRGDVNSTPAAVTFRLTNATTADIAGSDWSFDGSRSTGSAAGGYIRFRCSPAGGAGTTLNALAERFRVDGVGVGFFGTAPAAQATIAALTNNVTAGGSDDVIANYTDLTTYATDAAAIRNNIYQLARKVAQLTTAMRDYGLAA